MNKALARLLLVIPVLIINVLADVFITYMVSYTIFFQLLFYGMERHWALITSIVIAIVVYAYVVFSYKIRFLIKDNGDIKHE
jgi:uncharacterized membrane protein